MVNFIIYFYILNVCTTNCIWFYREFFFWFLYFLYSQSWKYPRKLKLLINLSPLIFYTVINQTLLLPPLTAFLDCPHLFFRSFFRKYFSLFRTSRNQDFFYDGNLNWIISKHIIYKNHFSFSWSPSRPDSIINPLNIQTISKNESHQNLINLRTVFPPGDFIFFPHLSSHFSLRYHSAVVIVTCRWFQRE